MSSIIFNCIYLFLVTQLCCQNTILEAVVDKGKQVKKKIHLIR